jgi:hypothetical protein
MVILNEVLTLLWFGLWMWMDYLSVRRSIALADAVLIVTGLVILLINVWRVGPRRHLMSRLILSLLFLIADAAALVVLIVVLGMPFHAWLGGK